MSTRYKLQSAYEAIYLSWLSFKCVPLNKIISVLENNYFCDKKIHISHSYIDLKIRPQKVRKAFTFETRLYTYCLGFETVWINNQTIHFEIPTDRSGWVECSLNNEDYSKHWWILSKKD